MKKILLINLLILSGAFLFGQHNEISISTRATYKSILDKGLALSYFRATAPQSALGIRLNYSNNREDYVLKNRPVIDLDISHRWNLLRNERFRFLTEVGSSFRREQHFWFDPLFCGTGLPIDGRAPYTDHYREYSTNSLMGIARLGIDVRIFKSFRLGTGCDARFFILRNNNENGENLQTQSYLNFSYIF